MRVTGRREMPKAAEFLAGPANRLASEILFTGVNHLNAVVPVDKGTGRASLQPNVTLTRVEGSPLPSRISFGSTLGYLASLNSGKRRGPGGRPPVAAIERWIERKGLAPTKKRGSRRVRDKKARKAMAFAIATAIAEGGQKKPLEYVSGPNAGTKLKGWFDSLGPYLAGERGRLLAAFKADVIQEWKHVLRA
ncbi:MAG: hypothetical protein H6648_08715 [Caldilineae bacterium]|nr:hypothetical protein [Caldilineae bacterium]